MTTLKSFRLSATLLERIESIARTKRVKFSAALRFALERGVAALERESTPPAPIAATAPEPPRRRVLSRGVGV